MKAGSRAADQGTVGTTESRRRGGVDTVAAVSAVGSVGAGVTAAGSVAASTVLPAAGGGAIAVGIGVFVSAVLYLLVDWLLGLRAASGPDVEPPRISVTSAERAVIACELEILRDFVATTGWHPFVAEHALSLVRRLDYDESEWLRGALRDVIPIRPTSLSAASESFDATVGYLVDVLRADGECRVRSEREALGARSSQLLTWDPAAPAAEPKSHPKPEPKPDPKVRAARDPD